MPLLVFQTVIPQVMSDYTLIQSFFFVREPVEENNICIEYVSTYDMLADLMMKCLPAKAYQELVMKMGFTRDLTWWHNAFMDKKCYYKSFL